MEHFQPFFFLQITYLRGFFLQGHGMFSHPLGCPGYVPPDDQSTDDDYSNSSCDQMILEELECNLPRCPDITDQEHTGIDTEASFAFKIDNVTDVNVGEKATFTCEEHCECLLFHDIR